jgi:hypothetical protein
MFLLFVLCYRAKRSGLSIHLHKFWIDNSLLFFVYSFPIFLEVVRFYGFFNYIELISFSVVYFCIVLVIHHNEVVGSCFLGLSEFLFGKVSQFLS